MKLRLTAALFGVLLPASAQYTGPAILSRGEAPAALSLPKIRFTPSVSVGASYDTGLSGIAIGDDGQLATAHSFGQTVSWYVAGAHSWKHTRLAISYNGSTSRYSRNSTPGNLNHNLMFGLTRQFSSRFGIDLRHTTGVSTRNYAIGGLAQTAPFDPTTTYVPTTDFFDNRNVYVTSSASATYLLTKRLSFNAAGIVFMNNRAAKSLTDAWGTNARGDLQYRLTARTSIGGTYSYQNFRYGGVAGGTDAHSGAIVYSIRINRHLEFSGQGGMVRSESTYLRQTPVDPVIAAILGITTTQQVVHVIQLTPSFSARLSRSMSHGVVYASAGRTVTPGNGLFLTSIATMIMGGYNTSVRRWGMNAQVAYVTADSTGNFSGNYGNLTETLGIGRALGRYLSLTMSVASRTYRSTDYGNYNRRITTATVGLGFTPGDVRLPTW